jgi:hypothetical protein
VLDWEWKTSGSSTWARLFASKSADSGPMAASLSSCAATAVLIHRCMTRARLCTGSALLPQFDAGRQELARLDETLGGRDAGFAWTPN